MNTPTKPNLSHSVSPKDREGYYEEWSHIEIRKDRSVYKRTVTITPPPWWSPKKPSTTPKKSKAGKEDDDPNNPLDIIVSPFKDMIDHFSRHGESKRKEEVAKKSGAQTKEEAQKRLERATGTVSDVTAELIFVHGSCASSSQFDLLVDALWEWRTDLKGKIRCHLFDAVGCGSSSHDPSDWNAYSSKEQMDDLVEVVTSVGSLSPSAPLYLVGHSYGCSQIIRLPPLLPMPIVKRIEGMVLISGGLAGGPSDIANAPCVFCLPVFCLRLLQPKMNDAFLEKAFCPSADEALLVKGRQICAANDMQMCKAFYRQRKWASKDDCAKLTEFKCVVIHGAEDAVIIPDAGEHLNDMLPNSEYKPISNAGHQVMEEKPNDVADALLDFVLKK